MKKENYHQDPSSLPPLHHRRRTRRNNNGPYMHRPRNQQQMVWIPTIPSWEKEFCLKNLGLFKWEDFLEAKRYLAIHHNVMEWDDSEAEEAFYSAKNQFLAAKQHPKDDNYNQYLMNLPDNLYADEIKWDKNHDDRALYDDIPDSISQREDQEEEEVENDSKVPQSSFNISMEYVKAHATGWDVDVQQPNDGDLLTGLIVGN